MENNINDNKKMAEPKTCLWKDFLRFLINLMGEHKNLRTRWKKNPNIFLLTCIELVSYNLNITMFGVFVL